MRFAFTEDQQLFQQAIAEMLAKECPHEAVAEAWQGETGRVPELWSKLAEMGVLGLPIPEEHGGLGMNELDLVLLLQETGRAAVPEPLVETIAVGAPLIRDLGGEIASEWLPRIASGDALLSVGLEPAPFVACAHIADLLLLQRGQELHAVKRERVTLQPQKSVDATRRLFRVDWTPEASTRVASGERAEQLLRDAFDRGALGTAAQLIGLGRYMVDLTVDYAKGREQFGQPIGSFQAVKHHLSNALVKLEFARPLVYHAAYTLVHDWESRARDISTAKAYASDAAHLCSRVALQCHGAIGYSFEYHLHLWMKRAWSLARAYGDAAWHRERVGRIVIDGAQL